jgi:hypothetical protein
MGFTDAKVNVAADGTQTATVYVDTDVVIPEDSFTPDGWPTNINFVGPGMTWTGTVIDLNAGDAADTSNPI